MYKITYNNTISQKQNNLKTSQLKYLKLYNQSDVIISQKQEFNIFLNNSNNQIIKIYIKTTLNNMFITYIINNKIITKSIAGLGFKGKAKQTRYAYKTFAETIINDLLAFNTSNNSIIVNLYLSSLNKKLKPFFTLFKTNNIKINKIYDLTPLPYNGCRKRKISIKKKKKSIIKYLSYK